MTVGYVPSEAASEQRRGWAKILTRRQLTDFEQALADPKLISLRQEIARVDARLAEVDRRNKRGESEKAWSGIKAQIGILRKALDEKNDTAAADAMAMLDRITEVGAGDYAHWQEVENLILLRRKLADTERKYVELHELTVPKARLALLFSELHGAIEAIIPERLLQLRLLQELAFRLNGERRDARAAIPVTLPAPYRDASAQAQDAVRDMETEDDLDSEPVDDEPSGS